MTEDQKDRAPLPSAERLRQEMAIFDARRQIVPLLKPGVLAEDIRERLAAADEAGSRLGPEIASQLHRLRDLQLGAEQSLTVIRAAANYVVKRYVASRERGGKFSTDQLENIDVPEVPAKTFAREFVVALGNQITWVMERKNRLQPTLRHDYRQGQGGSTPKQQPSQAEGPARQRDRELVDLQTRSSWTVSSTAATNADLLELATEFPTIEISRVRRMLVDQFANLGIIRESGPAMGGAGKTFRVPVSPTAAMDAVRCDLLPEIYGPPTCQITGPVACDDSGELCWGWFAISQRWADDVLLELPVLTKSDIRSAFADIAREILGPGEGVKAGPPSGLTWRRYGRGLQADAETALKSRLASLAENKAKQSAEHVAREAERAEQEAKRKREHAELALALRDFLKHHTVAHPSASSS
jgi:hypothetical protein